MTYLIGSLMNTINFFRSLWQIDIKSIRSIGYDFMIFFFY